MIRVQSSRPYIEIDGVRHYVETKTARLVELLLIANGKGVPTERVLVSLQTSVRALGKYITQARETLAGHGYKLVHETWGGYSLIAIRPIEFAVVQPK